VKSYLFLPIKSVLSLQLSVSVQQKQCGLRAAPAPGVNALID